MKTGKSILELAQELDRQARAKTDFITPTDRLALQVDGNTVVSTAKGAEGEWELTNHAHNQISERVGIPSKYYQRMKEEEPRLLAENVNTWFQKKPERRLIRTMTLERPVMRAFLSDRYRRLDNMDLMQAVIPFMTQEYGRELRIESADVTDTKLYLKVVAPHTERDLTTLLKPGTHTMINEIVHAGFIIQNSEIGMGALSANVFVKILRCSNGLMVEEFGQRRYHTGKRSGGGEDSGNADIFSDQTRQLEDAALWSKIKDVIRACLDEAQVTKVFTAMAQARDLKIEQNPEDAVEVLANTYGLNDKEKGGVLRTLIDSGLGLSAYGLMNAVTEIAKSDELDYNRASELEALGGRLLTLPPTEWKQIAQAA